MHCLANRNMPLSFHDIWIRNRDLNPARAPRNANYLRIPPHNFASLKRLPLLAFPKAWNEENETKKSISSLKLYKK